MTNRAVVIAGDFRTWEHSIHSAHELLYGADVYVSIWSKSVYWHQVKPRILYEHEEIHIDRVYALLAQYNVKGVILEDHDLKHWQKRGYNANYLHRLRTGVDMLRKSGVKYESVLFMRPDLFFDGPGMSAFSLRASLVEPGEFVTMLSSHVRVHEHKTLNDFIFAVAPEDIDKAIPTVEAFQHFKNMDWHTFLCWWVVEKNKLKVINVEHPRIVVLRPPSREGMSFEDALKNSETWDDIYVLHCLQLEGIRSTIARWGKHAVLRAIQNLQV